MFATGETVGLAEWIIDDTCLVPPLSTIVFTLVLALNKKSKFFRRLSIIHHWKEKSDKNMKIKV